MEWSQKRKIIYSIVFFSVVVLLAAYPIYRLAHPDPTCSDKKQNGTETGVDCGGGCALQCLAEMKVPRIVWAKAFHLGNTFYDLGAYVENQNARAGVKSARYTFRAFSNSGEILVEKKGVTEIAPGAGLILFEPNIVIPENPDHVEVVFEQGDLSRWIKARTPASIVTTKNQNLKNADTKPRFGATLVNTDLVNGVANLALNAIIYDARRHPVAISRTFVDSISKGEEQDIFFTWPNRFTKNPRGGICTTPVDTMLVFDRSGSMDVGRKNPPEPLTTAKNAARAYVDAAEVVDKVGIVSFATEVSNPIDHELSIDNKAVADTVAEISIEKGSLQYTNLGDALKAAFAEISSMRHTKGAKQIIVALTDGVSNRPLDPINPKNESYAEEYAAEQASATRAQGVELYTIGLGSGISEDFLRDRIASTPAHYFNAPTAESLRGIYKNISETVCKPENFITEVIVMPRAIFAQ